MTDDPFTTGLATGGELAKLATSLTDAVVRMGGYLGRVVGTLPEDLVGLLAADPIRLARYKNIVRMASKAQEELTAKGIEPIVDPSPNVMLPLFEGGANESRDGLHELWARLVAAAMDPSRAKLVSRQFIEIVKGMEPIDALVLPTIPPQTGVQGQGMRDRIANALQVPGDLIDMSFHHLIELKCIRNRSQVEQDPLSVADVVMTSTGRELLRVLDL